MQEDLYISIIQKKLSGEITPAEATKLEQWLKEDPDHQVLANSIEKAWELGGNFNADIEVDLNADFATLEKRIKQDEAATVVQLKPRRNWLGIAAAIAVLIVAGFLINNILTPKVEWQVAENTSEEIQTINLADGSQVKLSKNSILKYPQTFDGKTRNLELSGEAFFDVERNPEQPFVVKTENGMVTVLGTSFNVRDFAGEPEMQVLVNTGKVKMEAEGVNEALILEKAEKGVYKKGAQELTELKAVSLNELAVYTKKLTFVNMPFTEVIKVLEDYYQVKFITKNLEVLNCPFTNTFNDKPLDFVLETVQTVFGLEFELEYNNTYSLSFGSCR